MGPAYPVLHWLFPKFTTTTVEIGRALIELVANGSTKQILENADINRIAARGARSGA
jgi:hypothetical protein